MKLADEGFLLHRFRLWVFLGRTQPPQAEQAAEKVKLLSFRGTLRAEESLFYWASIKERFLASLGMTK
jgi:hypothetical protein